MDAVMSAALGERPFDLTLRNLRLVNVFTGEIYPSEIGITDGRVAHVAQPGESGLRGRDEYDCGGAHALPGLIDTHVHIESGMLTPANFAAAVVPRGTTTVLADPHEICNVLGVEGFEYCGRAGANILLRVLWAAPSCVPSVPGVESSKAAFGPAEIARMLDMPHCLALGEVMDYPGVVAQQPRMMAILAEALKRRKIIQGHIMGVDARRISAYRAAGCESDHEARELDEVLMKLRAGMVVECRYGSSAKNIPVEARALAMTGYPVNATLCTDDREADDLIREGHVDEAIRQAVRHGVPPVEAVRMATRNAALFLGLKDRGGLRPGALADIVLADSLEEFSARTVFIGGRLCAENGRLLAAVPAGSDEIESRNTMNVKGRLERGDFCIAADGPAARLNALSFVDGDPFHTTLKAEEFAVRGGRVDVASVPGYVTMAVVERHNATGNIGLAPAENIGLVRGAVAGTVSHDSHNLFVFGTNPDDMLAAARHLVETGGGFAAAENGRVVADIRLPVCGLMSTRPAAEVAEEVAAMKEALRALGIRNASPVNFLTWFCLAVLPEVRLTDRGLIDTVSQKPIPRFAE